MRKERVYKSEAFQTSQTILRAEQGPTGKALAESCEGRYFKGGNGEHAGNRMNAGREH